LTRFKARLVAQNRGATLFVKMRTMEQKNQSSSKAHDITWVNYVYDALKNIAKRISLYFIQPS